MMNFKLHLKRYWKKRWVKILCLFILLMGIFWIFKTNILRGIGNNLIVKDPLQKCDAIVVLSGSADERAKHAALLYKQGYAPKIICTGEIIPENIAIAGLSYNEGDLTALALTRRYHVPDSVIIHVPTGTSTREEALIMAQYAQKHQLKKLMLVSTAFHTKRAKYIFKKAFRKTDVLLCAQPAPATDYNEQYWWKDEEGLLTVNNEYAKKIYYFLKY